mmetsp:Transcript_7140/g.24786  ORF Transcript_7140/g.24786 Transcript_7140/m.24786 type:complete len:88 (-) Transcript_7140:525-788(-)
MRSKNVTLLSIPAPNREIINPSLPPVALDHITFAYHRKHRVRWFRFRRDESSPGKSNSNGGLVAFLVSYPQRFLRRSAQFVQIEPSI